MIVEPSFFNDYDKHFVTLSGAKGLTFADQTISMRRMLHSVQHDRTYRKSYYDSVISPLEAPDLKLSMTKIKKALKCFNSEVYSVPFLKWNKVEQWGTHLEHPFATKCGKIIALLTQISRQLSATSNFETQHHITHLIFQ